MIGEYDCANPRCSRYHCLTERRHQDDVKPKCPSCRKNLRLIQVLRGMDEATKRKLRERKAEQRRPA